MKKCQLLANLCVLQLYNTDTVACKLYKDLVANITDPTSLAYPENYNDDGFKIGMPWLYYET